MLSLSKDEVFQSNDLGPLHFLSFQQSAGSTVVSLTKCKFSKVRFFFIEIMML